MGKVEQVRITRPCLEKVACGRCWLVVGRAVTCGLFTINRVTVDAAPRINHHV